MYRFKFYYEDGTSEYVGGRGKDPTLLYNDFDGLLGWDEFSNLSNKNLTTKEILNMAKSLYKDFLKQKYNRIEIVNDETNEIVDYIDIKDEI